jgi:hypothetical protein
MGSGLAYDLKELSHKAVAVYSDFIEMGDVKLCHHLH